MRISDWSSDVCSSDLVQVRTSVRLEKCYLKHGTSIAVRLYVIDKVPGGAIAATIQRSSIRELIGALAIPARTALVLAPAAPLRRSANPSLFRSAQRRVGKEGVRPCSSRWFPSP